MPSSSPEGSKSSSTPSFCRIILLGRGVVASSSSSLPPPSPSLSSASSFSSPSSVQSSPSSSPPSSSSSSSRPRAPRRRAARRRRRRSDSGLRGGAMRTATPPIGCAKGDDAGTIAERRGHDRRTTGRRRAQGAGFDELLSSATGGGHAADARPPEVPRVSSVVRGGRGDRVSRGTVSRHIRRGPGLGREAPTTTNLACGSHGHETGALGVVAAARVAASRVSRVVVVVARLSPLAP